MLCRRFVLSACNGSSNLNFCRLRYLATQAESTKPKKDPMKIVSKPPERINRDWIGPADGKSNLRPVKFFIPEDEVPAEKEYRQKRLETEQWNQEFWEAHNYNFFKSKEAYIKMKLAEFEAADPENPRQKLTAEELSVFYKQFLDENYDMHMAYNKAWYKRNFSLLWPAFRVFIHRQLKRNRTTKAS